MGLSWRPRNLTLGEMAVELTVLGSGSAGNATLVSHAGRNILIDVGLSYRDVSRRLEQLDVTPDRIDAIMITHAHGDHTRGARTLARRHDVPVYSTDGVRSEWGVTDVAECHVLVLNTPLEVAGLQFVPFEIPHDASETVGFHIDTPDGAIGYATDIGTMTPLLIERFRDCRVLVIESNHATELLRVSPYARSTRDRIAGPGGHLSNEALAAFIRDHLGAAVRCVVLAHLSRVNNLPELAEMSCREALAARRREDVEVVVTQQNQAVKTIDLGAWLSERVRLSRAVAQVPLPFN